MFSGVFIYLTNEKNGNTSHSETKCREIVLHSLARITGPVADDLFFLLCKHFLFERIVHHFLSHPQGLSADQMIPSKSLTSKKLRAPLLPLCFSLSLVPGARQDKATEAPRFFSTR